MNARSFDEQSRSRGLQSGDGALGLLALTIWLGARYPVRGWPLVVLFGVGAGCAVSSWMQNSAGGFGALFRSTYRGPQSRTNFADRADRVDLVDRVDLGNRMDRADRGDHADRQEEMLAQPVASIRFRGPIAVGFLALAVVSVLSQRSLRGQHLQAGLFDGQATLLTDPRWRGPLLGAEARVAGKRVSVTASGAPAWRLARAEAGNVVTLRGRVSPIRTPVPSFMTARHLAAKLSVQKVSSIGKGDLTARFANGVRHRMLASGSVLSAKSRSLYGGFLLGDDRDQAPEVTDDFRAAGLTHLLVVSGQNVAFTLAVFSPLLMRLSLRSRFVTVLMILGVFALVTRFEPSVLRAVAMAALVALSRLLGRPQHSARILAIAVICMLTIDPLLAWSVGFALSVGACSGLALLVPWFERMRGPRWLVTPLATTLAAQTGASLVMIPVFGSVPVVAPLANMFALPAAAPIMSWGVAAGFPASFLGKDVARLVHMPTEFLLRWIAGVARFAAMLPFGQIEAKSLLVAAGLVGLFRIGSDFLRSREPVTELVLVDRFVDGESFRSLSMAPLTDKTQKTDTVRRTDKAQATDTAQGTDRAQGTDIEREPDAAVGIDNAQGGRRRTSVAVWFVLTASIVPTFQAVTTFQAVPPLIVKGGEVLGVHSVAGGVMRTVDVLVVSHGVDPARLLSALRKHRIRAVGTVVIASGGRPQTKVVAALRQRVSIGAVLAGDRAFAGLAPVVLVPNPSLIFGSGSRSFLATTGLAGKVAVIQTG